MGGKHGQQWWLSEQQELLNVAVSLYTAIMIGLSSD